MKTNIDDRITGGIVAKLERGVRPWPKPWNAEHAAGRTTRPLRHNGAPYQGINVLVLWGSEVCPYWSTPSSDGLRYTRYSTRIRDNHASALP